MDVGTANARYPEVLGTSSRRRCCHRRRCRRRRHRLRRRRLSTSGQVLGVDGRGQ